MKAIIKSELYVMNSSNGRIYNDMSVSQKIKALIEDGRFEKSMHLICSRPIGMVFDYNTNYAKEIVSKIKIPILFYDNLTGTYNGRITKPYFVLAKVDDLVPLIQYIPNNNDEKEEIEKYKSLHLDSDGSNKKYKENLEKILKDSEVLFNSVPVLRSEVREMIEGVDKNMIRTRKK